MSDAKFTPGPWRICTTGNMSNVVEAFACKTDEYDDGFRAVAIVQACVCDVRDGLREANGRANMALIAAAPDLYEALELLLNDVEHYPAWQRPCHAVDRARAALAKARER